MMPITIKCPNESCAKSFRVQDAAAGKTGKCPVCGTRIVIPTLPPAPDLGPAPDEFAVLKPVAAPYRSPGPGPSIIKPETAVAAGGVVRFEAIGEAWRLFKQHAGVWIAAMLIVGFGSLGVQVVLNLLSIPISIVGGRILPGISFLTTLGSLAVSMAVWGIFRAVLSAWPSSRFRREPRRAGPRIRRGEAKVYRGAGEGRRGPCRQYAETGRPQSPAIRCAAGQ
jgi:hypothetical protein